jgi:glutaredoxin
MWWTWLTSWWPGRRPRLEHLRFLLYTRRGCHLCDTARETLERSRRRYGFALEVQDVDQDAELVRLHGNWVPVVTVNGKLRFRGGVNRVLLERLLRAEARKTSDK